jgi:hypothetical protein
MRPCRSSLAIALLGLYVALLTLPATARAEGFVSYITSTFDTDAEGWTLWDTTLGNMPISYGSSAGNPGGYVFAEETSIGDVYFQAPAPFLGNRSSSYNHYLEFDLTDAWVDPEWRWCDVYLVGANLTLALDLSNPSTTDFTHYKISLNENAGWQKWHLGMPPPTQSEMRDVLSSLNSIRIEGDWHAGVDYTRLDNVRLGHSPEPGLLAFAFCGLAGGVMACRRGRAAKQ